MKNYFWRQLANIKVNFNSHLLHDELWRQMSGHVFRAFLRGTWQCRNDVVERVVVGRLRRSEEPPVRRLVVFGRRLRRRSTARRRLRSTLFWRRNAAGSLHGRIFKKLCLQISEYFILCFILLKMSLRN